MTAQARIWLSPPQVGAAERALLLDAFDSNWIAPAGPHLDAFEAEVAALAGVRYAVAVSSGTAALHLALVILGAGRGDDVLVPSLTFAAPANAVTYVGARPVFVDSEWRSWNIDPDLVANELRRRAATGRLPKAVIAVDLYGQCANYERLIGACAEHGVPVVEDAAEALGASYRNLAAGSLGSIGVLSFNGNKIITTGGGGMFLTDSLGYASLARKLAHQAREPVRHYEHREVGFNYRMSNLLAAVGRGQLQQLHRRVASRRAVFRRYRDRLGATPGITFMPEAADGRSTHWLTVVLVNPDEFGATRDDIIGELEARNIEARPAWKPMHQQPAFAGCPSLGGEVADAIFERGLCLPSGSALTECDIDRVTDAVLTAPRARVSAHGR